jgi:hypothetical protein
MPTNTDRLSGTSEFVGKDDISLHLKVQKVTSNDGTQEAVLIEFIQSVDLTIGYIPGQEGESIGKIIQGFGVVMDPQTVESIIEYLTEKMESIPFKGIEVSGVKIEQ